jgi:hypothetical protein
MKRYVLPPVLAVLVFLSCDTGEYPPYTYTNNAPYGVSFKTREENSPVYLLEAGASISLDSGIRGREDIDDRSIKPPYVAWGRANNDVYNITFQIEDTPIPMEIHNKTTDAITLGEERGYIEGVDVVVLSGGSMDTTHRIFTETPSFTVLRYNYPVKVDYRIEYDDEEAPVIMYVSIHY